MKKIIVSLIVLCLLASPVHGQNTGGIAEARNYWLYETSSGKVLAEYRSSQQVPAASLTKLMTCLLTLEALERGEIDWSEAITLPESYVNPGGSSMDLTPGQRVTIRELLSGVMIVSANDGAQLLAARLGGNEDLFAKRMNSRAKELGMDQTLFLNCTGLPQANGQNMTSAADVGLISSHLLALYQEPLLGITGQRLLTNAKRNYAKPTTNTLMYLEPGVDGLKTGHTDDAGYCLAATMPFQLSSHSRLIAVVMGTADEKSRNEAGRSLLNWAGSHYQFAAVINAKSVYSLGHWKGIGSRPIEGHPAESVERLIPKNAVPKVTVSSALPQMLPLMKGDAVGMITASLPGGEQISIPLLSDTEILSLTWQERLTVFLKAAGDWFRSLLVS